MLYEQQHLLHTHKYMYFIVQYFVSFDLDVTTIKIESVHFFLSEQT